MSVSTPSVAPPTYQPPVAQSPARPAPFAPASPSDQDVTAQAVRRDQETAHLTEVAVQTARAKTIGATLDVLA